MARFVILFALLLKFVSSISLIERFDMSAPLDNRIGVKNDAPIIGVMAQESLVPHIKYKTYIAASYIKFVEGGGARAVPIWIDKPESYYESMLSKVNGVLFPGGDVFLNETRGYAVAGATVYKIAKRLNENGIYFPLFGTCLGFELLLYFSNNNQDYRTICLAEGQALPLNLTKNFRQSHLFGTASEEIVDILENEPVTANYHTFCLTERNLKAYHLDNFWKVLSYNNDINGLKFISSIEHKTYPFYAVQFHPEKNSYEWKNINNPHTPNAVKVTQYIGNFFINECRKNGNHFSGPEEEDSALIYNYPVTFTGRLNSIFEQMYLFPDNV